MRVDVVLFRRRFTLDVVPREATLHLFAATRYRLYVNGRIVAHGPARFVPGREQFDSIDLAPHLAVGENTIVAEVRFVDANNFQSMPGDRGRFIAWGRAGDAVDLATPGDWTAGRCDALRQDAPAFSFAIGPAEVLDVARHQACLAGKLHEETPAALDVPPTLAPRAVPMSSGERITPQAVFASPLEQIGPRIGCVSVDADHDPTHTFAYVTFLHTPVAGPAELLLHWGPHWLNGVEIDGEDDPVRGNCRSVAVTLRRGWNLLCGRPGQNRPNTPLLIQAPIGTELRSTPHLADAPALRVLPPSANARWTHAPPADANDLNLADPAWRLIAPSASPPCPARLVAWDRPDAARRTEAPTLPVDVPAGEWMALFDVGTEFLGHIEITLDAPAGTIVDVAYDERLRDDGCLGLFATNPLVETADRFIWPGGHATISTFEPRGGRFVQIVVRTQQPSTLHALAVRDARCLPVYDGAFSCDDATLAWAWDRGLRTLRASAEDVYCDSPWRERGTYLGDSYVQSLVHIVVSPDRSMPRQSLRLFADGRRGDGQLPGVVPAWLRKPHGDFSLIFAIWLRDWWARTGDRGTVAHCLPAAEGVLTSPTWRGDPLWEATEDNRLFIDWGVDKGARLGRENAVLNAFRTRALDCVAELRRALGEDDGAAFDEEAATVRAAFQARLWRGDRFAMSGESDAPCLHANLLALAFDLATGEQARPLLTHCLDRLATNAAKAARGVAHDDFAELYFLKYALDGLVRVGRFDVAERVIAEHYGLMRHADADCLWECLHRGVRNLGSLCHSWSAAATEYLGRHVLGVREATPGDPNRLLVAPNVSTIHAASGTVAHPLGPIRVRWTRNPGGAFTVDAAGPAGVDLASV